MQPTPDDNSFCLPVAQPFHDDSKPSTPVFGIARQVVGFSPVSKDIDAIRSPRSVLTNIGSGCLQMKSPRSPRSDMEGLISGPRTRENKGSQGVGLGIVAALSTAGDEIAATETPKGLPTQTGIAVPCVNSSTSNQQQHSLSQSQPIPIAQLQSISSPQGKRDHHQTAHSRSDKHQESFSWSAHGLRSHSNKQERVSSFNASSDVEMEVHESIFSAASPASSCSENSGLLPEIDFLSACYFCKQQLQQEKDIYMYRGDKAFCSVECRYQQILIDERKEKCASSLKSGNSGSPSNAKHRCKGLTTTMAAAA